MTVSLNDSFITTRTSPEYSTSSATVNANAETRATTPAGSANSTKDRATVTTLAGQLSDAALRAKASYGSHTKQQLKTMHHENFQRLTGREYNNNKTQHDTETPNTSDPTLLERAHMATRYVNNLGGNPFAGMPRDQLELIIFDDSGSFTINERRAALYEDYNQEQAWRKQVLAEYDIEKSSTGKGTRFYQNVLDHYRALPSVAKSQYPDDYEAKLQEWIDSDLNLTTASSEDKKTSKILSPEIAQKILPQDTHRFKTAHSPEQIGDAPTLDKPGVIPAAQDNT